MTPYYDHGGVTIYHADCRDVLPSLSGADSICTSPPYWRLRDYGPAGQTGLEETPEEFVATLVDIFRLARRSLLPTGCLWLNLGDTYAASGKGGGGSLAAKRAAKTWAGLVERTGFRMPTAGYKQKDLVLSAFGVADALRADGWYLRSTVIWEKGSAIEPPRRDRPSNCHEYLFLLSGSEDCGARDPGRPWWKTTVWRVPAESDGTHPAAMPMELAARLVACSSSPGGLVIDPFCGQATTLLAAKNLGRRAIGIDIEERHCEAAAKRLSQEVLPLAATGTEAAAGRPPAAPPEGLG